MPSSETGLMPIEAVSGKRIFLTPISVRSQSTTLAASGVPYFHSMPA